MHADTFDLGDGIASLGWHAPAVTDADAVSDFVAGIATHSSSPSDGLPLLDVSVASTLRLPMLAVEPLTLSDAVSVGAMRLARLADDSMITAAVAAERSQGIYIADLVSIADPLAMLDGPQTLDLSAIGDSLAIRIVTRNHVLVILARQSAEVYSLKATAAAYPKKVTLLEIQ